MVPAPGRASAADGPFQPLEWADGVTTSRNGYAVWVSMNSIAHVARIPGFDRPVAPPEHGVALGVSCRAPGGGMPERFPPVPASGEIYLRNHPEHSGAYLVFHPMYWFLELTGRAEDRWLVRVRIGDRPSVAATLVRTRTDYSAPHPGLSIQLPGALVLDAIAADDSISVGADGSGFALDARFVPSANARRAAALMRAACTAATS